VHVAPEEQEARGAVLFDETRPEDLRERAVSAALPQVELPEPIARGVEALREEHIVELLCVDMGHAPRIDEDLRARGKAFQAMNARRDRARFGARGNLPDQRSRDCDRDGRERALKSGHRNPFPITGK
jgi:hypothetical protein